MERSVQIKTKLEELEALLKDGKENEFLKGGGSLIILGRLPNGDDVESTLAVAGSGKSLILNLAKAMEKSPKFKELVGIARKAAPMMGIMEFLEGFIDHMEEKDEKKEQEAPVTT